MNTDPKSPCYGCEGWDAQAEIVRLRGELAEANRLLICERDDRVYQWDKRKAAEKALYDFKTELKRIWSL